MNAAFAARLVLEVLHGVRQVHVAARDAGHLQRLVEYRARRSNKRLALAVFLIPRHFADQHDIGLARTLAEDCLSGAPIQLATAARRGRFAERGQREPLGKKLRR